MYTVGNYNPYLNVFYKPAPWKDKPQQDLSIKSYSINYKTIITKGNIYSIQYISIWFLTVIFLYKHIV